MTAGLPMPLRTCSMRTLPSVAGSSFGVVFGPRVRCQTNVLGIDRLLAPRARAIANRRGLDAALACRLLHRRQALQPLHRRPHHVVRIRRSEALRENVRDARAFHHRAHRAASDDTGARRCGLHQYATRPVFSNDLVRDRAARERNAHHLTARRIDRLTDGFRNLVRLASRETDLPLSVTDGHERVEREPPTALHDFRDTVDGDHVLYELAALAATVAGAATTATLSVTAASAAAAVTSVGALAAAAARAAAEATAATAATAATGSTTASVVRRTRLLILCHVRTPTRLRGLRRPPLSRGRDIGILLDRTRRWRAQRPSPSAR